MCRAKLRDGHSREAESEDDNNKVAQPKVVKTEHMRP